MAVLETAQTVAGYTRYLDLIAPMVTGKKIISSGMTKEIDRVTAAILSALEQGPCVLVCSGDPGIYALAGLVFEICRSRGIAVFAPGHAMENKGGICVEVVPGVPSLCAGAALLGAPLVHDFTAISLSDRLTPWEVIEKRIDAAAMADFVIVLHNPKSKSRVWQLEKACRIIGRYRKKETPAGLVRRAMRENQSVELCTLGQLPGAEADMETIVYVGNSQTFIHDFFMVTPRGYAQKYGLSHG